MNEAPSLIEKCPACEGNVFEKHLELKDYFLSQEPFSLIKCRGCGLLYTDPWPDKKLMASYYDSEEYTSHNTNKGSLKNLLYNQARRLALYGKQKLIRKYSDVGKVLDIGSGTGEFLNYCRAKGWEVLGLEPNEKARKISVHKNNINALRPEEISKIEKLSLDVITMWHVLEHLQEPDTQFSINHGMLKENGVLVVALPNYESWDAKKYGKFWAAYDVPRHLFHFTEQSVKRLAQKTGFEIINMTPLKLDAYYISLLSEKYASGKVNYLKAAINGWRSNYMARKGKIGFSSWVYVMRKK